MPNKSQFDRYDLRFVLAFLFACIVAFIFYLLEIDFNYIAYELLFMLLAALIGYLVGTKLIKKPY
jgi:hypothetical protein